MKKYTIGAFFNSDFTHVLLIKKIKPDWQKGKLNFPGGSLEVGESPEQCISREFQEETGLKVAPEEWKNIGIIESQVGYEVYFLAAVWDEKKHGEAKSITEEIVDWEEVDNLPYKCISNVRWLVPFAVNYFCQGNVDQLNFGIFKYINQ